VYRLGRLVLAQLDELGLTKDALAVTADGFLSH
jgi:hypothetical protein